MSFSAMRLFRLPGINYAEGHFRPSQKNAGLAVIKELESF